MYRRLFVRRAAFDEQVERARRRGSVLSLDAYCVARPRSSIADSKIYCVDLTVIVRINMVRSLITYRLGEALRRVARTALLQASAPVTAVPVLLLFLVEHFELDAEHACVVQVIILRAVTGARL